MAAFMRLDSLKVEHLSYHRADALMDDGLAPSEQVARQTEDGRSIRPRGTTGQGVTAALAAWDGEVPVRLWMPGPSL